MFISRSVPRTLVLQCGKIKSQQLYLSICIVIPPQSSVKTSVADPDPVFLGHPDPDPDPGKYRIRIRILYPQKDPMLFKFSRYKNV